LLFAPQGLNLTIIVYINDDRVPSFDATSEDFLGEAVFQ
jgi:hypothetical protein